MAKSKSKKSSKSRTKKTEAPAAALQLPPPPKQLNPFYIEQQQPPVSYQSSQVANTWDGDYDWNNDPDEEEQAGLLLVQPAHPRGHQQYSWEDEQRYGYNASQRQQRHHAAHSSYGSVLKTRALILFTVVTVIFWVVLSSFADHPNNNNNNNNTATSAPVNRTNNNELIQPPPSTKNDSKDESRNPPSQDGENDDSADEDEDEVDDDKVEDDVDDDTTSGEAANVNPHVDADEDKDEDDDASVDEPATPTSGTSVPSTNSTNETAAPSSSNKSIQIVVLGERHSGVDWLLKTLQSCYTDIPVTSGLTREAYWFQDAILPQHDTTTTTSTSAVVLVVGIVRDPYDWLQDMWLHPAHMPVHQNGSEPLRLREFLRKEWSIDSDHVDNRTNNNAVSCQLGFTPDRVVPCLQEEDATMLDTETPIYELNPATGQAFANIMALRAAKLQHLLDDIPTLWNLDSALGDGVTIVKYESGLTDAILNSVDERVGTVASCSANRTTLLLPPPLAPIADAALAQQIASPMYYKWMGGNVDWKVEARVGYSRRPTATRTLRVS